MQGGNAPRAASHEPAAPVVLSLTELADAAGVTVRTIRYYIAEGLLPPPVGAGPQSGYTTGHLERLRLIARLKDAYLPLKEIRRQLTGLDDAAVHAALTSAPTTTAGTEAVASVMERASGPGSARDYLDAVLPPRTLREAAAPYRAPERTEAPAGKREPARSQGPLPAGVSVPATAPAPVAAPLPAPAEAAAETWRRVRLTDDAELLIRDGAYRRHRDRIEWLVGWARRVLT